MAVAASVRTEVFSAKCTRNAEVHTAEDTAEDTAAEAEAEAVEAVEADGGVHVDTLPPWVPVTASKACAALRKRTGGRRLARTTPNVVEADEDGQVEAVKTWSAFQYVSRTLSRHVCREASGRASPWLHSASNGW